MRYSFPNQHTGSEVSLLAIFMTHLNVHLAAVRCLNKTGVVIEKGKLKARWRKPPSVTKLHSNISSIHQSLRPAAPGLHPDARMLVSQSKPRPPKNPGPSCEVASRPRSFPRARVCLSVSGRCLHDTHDATKPADDGGALP